MLATRVHVRPYVHIYIYIILCTRTYYPILVHIVTHPNNAREISQIENVMRFARNGQQASFDQAMNGQRRVHYLVDARVELFAESSENCAKY